MTATREMLRTTPSQPDFDAEALARCIEACFECEQTCTACADACLGEEMVAELVRCVRLNLDCADICGATGRLLSRQTGYDPIVTQAVLEACATACRSCADECTEHAGMHEHCLVCAEACRRCEAACEKLLASFG